jgi:glycosyltransferase involved in cell wall biosynthesis
VCFSHASVVEATEYALVPPENTEMIYLGVPEPVGHAPSLADKRELVVSVGYVNDSSVYRKGFHVVAQVSKLLPDVQFVIAGEVSPPVRELLAKIGGDNLRLTGFLDDSALQSLYRSAKVYLQPSLHEGFGMSVAEAMLQQCIPVVSAAGSLREVAGETGYYVDPTNPMGVAEAVRLALQNGNPGSLSPRSHVRSMFSVDRRRSQLLALVDRVIGCRKSARRSRSDPVAVAQACSETSTIS